jgi:hypothetical protein
VNSTDNQIRITAEFQHKGAWIKIIVPEFNKDDTVALLKSRSGTLIRRVQLQKGLNAIDVSQIDQPSIFVQVESPYETVLKELSLISV